jgi:hypothetical protein
MRVRCLFGLAALAGAAASANALTFQCRWVERVGSVDTVIGGDGATLSVTPGSSHRLRLQFAVVDDASGGAPDGGFVGWNVGTLSISGPASNSQDRRTGQTSSSGGRLSPFNFAGQPTANGNPPPSNGVNGPDGPGDDFSGWTDIDATLGTQAFAWTCDANGNPAPQPQALVRGRNSFVSVYEITTTTNAATTNYSITAGGNLIAATEWRPVGTPTPPDCGDPADPSDDINGSVTYAPFPTAPEAFNCVLNIVVPAPGAAALLGLGGLLVARRRR